MCICTYVNHVYMLVYHIFMCIYVTYVLYMYMQAQKPSFIPRPLYRNESGFQSLMHMYICHICFHVYMSLLYLYIWPICRHAKILQTCICVYSTYPYIPCVYVYVSRSNIYFYICPICMYADIPCMCVYI